MTDEEQAAMMALAYQEGNRSIDDQARTLENLRGRAATLFSAAGVIGGFLVGLVVNKTSTTQFSSLGWPGLAVGAGTFLVIAIVTMAIWWPATMQIRLDPGRLIVDYIETEPPATLADIHREVALWRHQQINTNSAVLHRRVNLLLMALSAFPLEVIALLLSLQDVAR